MRPASRRVVTRSVSCATCADRSRRASAWATSSMGPRLPAHGRSMGVTSRARATAAARTSGSCVRTPSARPRSARAASSCRACRRTSPVAFRSHAPSASSIPRRSATARSRRRSQLGSIAPAFKGAPRGSRSKTSSMTRPTSHCVCAPDNTTCTDRGSCTCTVPPPRGRAGSPSSSSTAAAASPTTRSSRSTRRTAPASSAARRALICARSRSGFRSRLASSYCSSPRAAVLSIARPSTASCRSTGGPARTSR
jgi:hypothetical protein